MGDTGPFSVGEKALVPHTDKFYEAKVLKAQFRPDGLWYYLLHYTGWNKKWDEWVEQTGLQRAHTGQANNAKRGGRGQAGAGQKRRRPEDGPAGEAASVAIDLEVPAALKQQLLAEYDAVHDDHKLVPLPRQPNVGDILDQYLQYAMGKQTSAEAEEDMVAGLKLYFDKALYHCLLYKSERHQADKVLAGGRVPSSVYGAEHLLRLFVKLPELLPQTGAPAEQQQLLARRLDDVLGYLQLNQQDLFLQREQYVSPSAAVAF